ncbi:hypothetical protein GALL_299760 [mine drainage metagenome]|uniref:Uncharacterized protein n=1 Tax=mine drainage metagenome TaxID=410659 RepID=A0A1J5QWV3_9ZZZZ
MGTHTRTPPIAVTICWKPEKSRRAKSSIVSPVMVWIVDIVHAAASPVSPVDAPMLKAELNITCVCGFDIFPVGL